MLFAFVLQITARHVQTDRVTEYMIQRFFDRDVLATTLQRRNQLDLTELRAAKAVHLKQGIENTVLDRWDTVFYAERVRRARYAVDQEQFRRYFPPDASLRFVFRLAEQVFDWSGLRLVERSLLPEGQRLKIEALGRMFDVRLPLAGGFQAWKKLQVPPAAA